MSTHSNSQQSENVSIWIILVLTMAILIPVMGLIAKNADAHHANQPTTEQHGHH